MNTFFIRKCFAFIIILSFQTTFLQAQSRAYLLSELVDAARQHVPLLMSREAAINSYKAAVTDAKHSFLPQLKLNDQINIGSDNSIAGAYLPMGAYPSVSAGVRNGNTDQTATGNIAVIYSEYELANFGLKSARITNAAAAVKVQEADMQRLLYQMKIEISKLYFNLLKNEYRLKADSENLNRYENIFTVINALALSGVKTGSDTALSKTELSKAKITFNQTAGTVNALKQQLAYWTGISAANIKADTSIVKPFGPDAAPYNASVDSINHPLLDYYAKQNASLVANAKLIGKSYLPKILLAGSIWARGSSIQYNDDYKLLSTGLGYQRLNYMAGIAVTYDLFNSVHKKDKLAISKMQTQANDFEWQQQKLALANALLQADNELQTADNNLKELPVQLQSATEVYNQKIAQYQAGLINLIDLTNASFVLYRSQTDYIETLGSRYLAMLNKAAAAGTLDAFINSLK